MPAAAHMARRPLRISLVAKSFCDAAVLPKLRGLKPKSPGARSPDLRPSVMAMPENTVSAIQKNVINLANRFSSSD